MTVPEALSTATLAYSNVDEEAVLDLQQQLAEARCVIEQLAVQVDCSAYAQKQLTGMHLCVSVFSQPAAHLYYLFWLCTSQCMPSSIATRNFYQLWAYLQ